jgi:type I restriction enzyme R subunit
MNTPSFQEDHISQVPALQLLQNFGYTYLRPQEVHLERKGKLSNVLLEGILAQQLRKLNRINYRGQQYEFSEANIQAAIQTLKDVPFDGLVRTSEKIYDLLSLGKALEQTIDGDTKSFTLQYINWREPEKNVFHVLEEFEVERTASNQLCRPDLVLFVNGIPLAVIECKRPDMKEPLEQAISQNIRNQADDYIPKLFTFTQLLVGVTKNEAAYGTTGTMAKFWLKWRELKESKTADISAEVSAFINRPLAKALKDKLFADRFGYVRAYFDELESESRQVTEQDKALYSLCRPERLMELAFRFIVFDAGEKKIARYQQYFAVKSIVGRVREVRNGRRLGGVVWHTQGSGKSLTMVMLAKSLALEPAIPNPTIVLVTDRIDLDEQIWKTFHQCGKEPVQAQTGKHLSKLIMEGKENVITTVIDKFAVAIETGEFKNESPNIFVLVDESHRSVYGPTGAKMEKVLPNACFIGFTGTPLMKAEKNTARKFGGIIPPAYTIDQAVKDKAVVPLLYEGRLVLQQVDQKAIDKWFELVTKPLTEAQRADLKKKFSTEEQLNKAERKIYEAAFDISEHYSQNWQGTEFKAQLAAPTKLVALKYKKYLDEFGKVTNEVVISAPDTREDNEEVEEVDTEEVRAFWKKMMAKYGSEKEYNKQIINAFKHAPEPEILIVVSKLLTGFDAPRNTVLYICRNFQEGHNLLQAIARVNRLCEGKDFGYVVDYFGVLQQLGAAMDIYGSLPDFDKEDLAGTVVAIAEEVASLPQKHSELWDVFKTVKNRLDEEEYETLLADEELRLKFYEKLCAYYRALGIALSTMEFLRDTPEKKMERYKKDLAFFLKLRVAVKKRYAEEIDFKDYEKRVQKLVDTHVQSEGVQQITAPVNIFEQEKFKAEVEKLQTAASKADTIAHRTQRTITEKMDEDPVFYRRFGKILQETIDAYRLKRISDSEYLTKATEVMNSVLSRTGDDLPPVLKNRDVAKAFYGVVSEVFDGLEMKEEPIPYKTANESANMAVQIDEAIQKRLRVDWRANTDVQNEMRNAIEDLLYEARAKKGVPLSTQDMDAIIERALEIAKNRYAR